MAKRTYGTGNAIYLGNNKWQLKYRPKWSPKPLYKTLAYGDEVGDRKRVEKELSDWVTAQDKLSKAPVALSVDTLHDLLIADYRRHNRETTADTSVKFKKHLYAYFANIDMVDLAKEAVERYIDHRQRQGAANGTINREISWLHKAVSLASDRKLTATVFRWERLDERASIRQGFISYEEYLSILRLLPSHLQMLWCFAYHWGIRKGELLKLRWEWALPYLADDEPIIKVPGFDRKTKRRITKNGEPHTLPLYAEEMREFLKLALSNRNQACPYIFQYRGKQLKSPRTGFENAREAAELTHVLIHDTRRTAIRNMVRAGIDKKRAMQISGHKTESVFDRYNITTEGDAVDTGVTMRGFMEKERRKYADNQKLVAKLVVDSESDNQNGEQSSTSKFLN